MTATPNIASDRAAEARAAAAPAAGPFVLNLCSSTTPMALAQTDLPELKRFTFFVSRRFEEGRERFRLHMGHFATLAEAEEWLSVVREIYPGAWAGEAPGRKLRERAAAAAATQAQYAQGPQPAHSATRVSAPVITAPPHVPVVHPAPPLLQAAPPKHHRPAQAEPAAARAVPTLKAPQAKPAAQAARPAAAAPAGLAAPKSETVPAASAAKRAAPPSTSAAAPAKSAAAPAKSAPPAVAAELPAPKAPPAITRSAPATAASATAPATPQRGSAGAMTAAQAPTHGAATNARQSAAAPAPRRGAKPVKPVFEDSNVREVLKALGDQQIGETREMQALPPPPPADSASLTDTQVLKMLETRRAEQSQPLPVEAEEGNIPLLKPDDTGTRRALKEAVTHNAPVSFAVQLQWSVQPPDLESVPPLAIFSAYTLYTVEGSRDGRKWYGLRLGFFTDAISAKQVAHYVRSEFASVAVVPVSPGEKARATDQEIAATLAAPAPARADPMDEFKLIEEAHAAAGPRPPPPPPPGATARVPLGRALREASAGRTAVGARERRGAHTLEETLEILGAGQLSIDNGNGTTLNDSGVRHLRVEVQKNSPFSRLLERLSERLKKS
jgi:hypothetical protein